MSLKQLLVTICLMFIAVSISADVPNTMNYQGSLTDAAGDPVVDGAYLVKFIIYDAAAGGTDLWNTGFQSVTTTNGLFSYQLGSIVALPNGIFSDTNRFLGITVGVDAELTPRTRFITSAYTFLAERADSANYASNSAQLGGQLPDSFASASHSHFENAFTVDNLNNIGVGTNNPAAKLHVQSSDATLGAIIARVAATGSFDTRAVIGSAILDTTIGFGIGGHFEGGYIGVYANAYGGGTNWAGYFSGNVNVNGTLSKAGGSFKIDHPLDPENKYLYHSFVESPDMMNIYNGNVITDANGYATVTMPNYFDALNKDFRYQLTVIGDFAQAIIAEKINGNQFRIRTDKPSIEVSWQVTGVRQDAWAKSNRIQVEEMKSIKDKGKYVHPKAFGLDIEEGIDYKLTKGASERNKEQHR